MSRVISSTPDPALLGDAIARVFGDICGGGAVLLLPDGVHRVTARAGDVQAWRPEAGEQWTYDRHFPAGRGTPTFPEVRWFYLPVLAGGRILGVIGVRPPRASAVYDQAPLLQALANVAAQALERHVIVQPARASDTA